MFLFRLVESAANFIVQLRLGQVALDINHLVRKPPPQIFIDVVNIELRGGVANKACQHAMKLVTPAFSGFLAPSNADQHEVLRQHIGAQEIVKCRQH